MFRKLVTIAAFFSFVHSSSVSAPLVAWSRLDIGHADPFSAVSEQDFTALLDAEGLCSFDAVVVIDQPGLHALDLKTLNPSSLISSHLKASHATIQRPYGRRHPPHVLSDSAVALARRCRSQMLWLEIGDPLELDATQGKHVIHLTLPSISGEGAWRKQSMSESDEILSHSLLDVERTFPKSVFIYTGSSSTYLEKRQDALDSVPFSFVAANGTSTGILHNFQLLTPGLIVSLFVVFFVLLPIILMAVNALSSIQSSVRLENPKVTGQDKKMQ